jgi:hypothetical protein
MAIAYSAAPQFEMGRVVKRTFSVIADNITTFALLSLLPSAALAVLSWGGNQFEDSAGVPTLPDLNTLALVALRSTASARPSATAWPPASEISCLCS